MWKVKTLSATEAFELLKSDLADLGFGRVLYAFSGSEYDKNLTNGAFEKPVILHSYRPDHAKLYEKKEFLENCAIVEFANTSTTSTRIRPLRDRNWGNKDFGKELLKDVREIIKSEEINDGIIVPMKASISSSRGGMSALIDGDIDPKETLQLISEHSNLVSHYLTEFHRALEHKTLLGPEMYLTKREREVLLWLSEGLKIKQLAHILGIAESTVEKQLIAARRRMNCPTTPSLLFKCLEYGLLE